MSMIDRFDEVNAEHARLTAELDDNIFGRAEAVYSSETDDTVYAHDIEMETEINGVKTTTSLRVDVLPSTALGKYFEDRGHSLSETDLDKLGERATRSVDIVISLRGINGQYSPLYAMFLEGTGEAGAPSTELIHFDTKEGESPELTYAYLTDGPGAHEDDFEQARRILIEAFVLESPDETGDEGWAGSYARKRPIDPLYFRLRTETLEEIRSAREAEIQADVDEVVSKMQDLSGFFDSRKEPFKVNVEDPRKLNSDLQPGMPMIVTVEERHSDSNKYAAQFISNDGTTMEWGVFDIPKAGEVGSLFVSLFSDSDDPDVTLNVEDMVYNPDAVIALDLLEQYCNFALLAARAEGHDVAVPDAVGASPLATT